ncbi:hypothetical protein [Tenacibaculum piscium]|uniref:hypothetical protein n=1 Tax=Tenacibaculum piscium TaxID=1458515 RepID=UPI001F36AD76|nr:hypothetical protein [Tenacibaculum piscium]
MENNNNNQYNYSFIFTAIVCIGFITLSLLIALKKELKKGGGYLKDTNKMEATVKDNSIIEELNKQCECK